MDKQAQLTRVEAYNRSTPSSRPGRWLDRWFPLFLAVLVSLLLFTRLDDSYLWQDEAETALISRHLMTFGLPLASDGHDWVQQTDLGRQSYTSSYLWTYHPWLQFAVTAASLRAFGNTTWAARLPFVLFGGLCTLFLHGFTLRWLSSQRIARVASLLLALCVPFLLLARQCRYYTLAAFFTLLVIDAYLYLRSGGGWALPYFVLSAILLYHAHFGAFLPTLAAIAIHSMLNPPARDASVRLIAGCGLTALLVAPWVVFSRAWTHGLTPEWGRTVLHLAQYVLYISIWIFPLLLAAVLIYAWARRHSVTGPRLSSAQASLCELFSLIVAVNLLFLSATAAFDWVFFRYVTHLIPLLVVMLAIVVAMIIEASTIAGYALLLAVVATNGLHVLPHNLPGLRQIVWSKAFPSDPRMAYIDDLWRKAHRFRSEPLMYWHELTQSYEGPNEGIIEYLREHATPGDTVLANYEELPLMFYTDLRVIGGLSALGVADNIRPDWIIDRRSGPYRDVLAEMVAHGSYGHIQLPFADLHWENRPDPGLHHFLTVREHQLVSLYKRNDDVQ